MANRFRLVMGVQVGRNLAALDLVVAGKPVDDRLRRLGRAVDFRPVAGRQDGDLPGRLTARQIRQRMLQFVGTKGDALADGERCGVVVDAEGKNHGAMRNLAKNGANYSIRVVLPRPAIPAPGQGMPNACDVWPGGGLVLDS